MASSNPPAAPTTPSASCAAPRASRVSRALCVAFVTLDAVGYGSAVGWVLFFATNSLSAAALIAATAMLAMAVAATRRRGRGFRALFEVLVLGVLVAWGLLVNHGLNAPPCHASPCGPEVDFKRFLAEPDVAALLALHVATVVAYAVSRRRPEALPPAVEVLVHALLLVGVIVHALLTVQFADAFPFALLLPIAMPAVAPPLTVLLYAAELVARLRRRGAEQPPPPAPAAPLPPAPLVYRRPDPPPPDPPAPVPRIHRGLLLRALAASPALLGAYTVAMRLFLHDWGGATRVFAQTCGHLLSQQPILPAERGCDCYVVTVAAQGHPSVVHPQRFGHRRGVIILVNRQLAVANAFEGLLHARWPRFGAFARRVYDSVGPTLSRLIVTRWTADLVYVLLKPAEWSFYLALLLLDPTPPEARIDRTYR
jgi:hypothetical protein